MGFFKSLKGKISSQEDQGQPLGPSADRKYLYEDGNQSPEIMYDDQRRKSKGYKATDYSSTSHSPTQYSAPEISQNQSEFTSNPPPYEAWLSVPDNSLLPPPPSAPNDYSPTNNATADSARKARSWCIRNPVYTPSRPNPAIFSLSQAHELGMDKPPNLTSRGTLHQTNAQTWQIKSQSRQDDTIFMSTVPAYFAAVQNPLLPGSSETTIPPSPVVISFTVTVTSISSPSSAGIAIGLASKPYPPFRLPGWHRASLAVHSDDGHRYTNDPYGGADFTDPFRSGDGITLSLTIFPRPSPAQVYQGPFSDVRPVSTLPKCSTRVEVLRNGTQEGGWDVHEERDGEKDEGVEGLQGESDLYICVGVFGAVEAVVRFGG